MVAMADGYRPGHAAAPLWSTCTRRPASATRSATSSPPSATRRRWSITAGQQARSLLPYDPFLGAEQAAELPKPYVKWSCEPARAEDVPAAIARAYHVAMQRPRGPTFVSVPVDDWDRADLRRCRRAAASHDIAPDPALLAELRGGAGGGAQPGAGGRRRGRCATAPGRRRSHWPSGSAPRSGPARCRSRNAFPEDHPLFAGFLAAGRAPIVAALAAHDLILVLGAPVFTYHVAGECALFTAGTPLFQLSAGWRGDRRGRHRHRHPGQPAARPAGAGGAAAAERPRPPPPRAPAGAARRAPARSARNTCSTTSRACCRATR